jgi:hypothetical protein
VFTLWLLAESLVLLVSYVLRALLGSFLLPSRAVSVVYGENVTVASDDDIGGAMERCRKQCALLSNLPLAAVKGSDKWELHRHILAGRSDWRWWN